MIGFIQLTGRQTYSEAANMLQQKLPKQWKHWCAKRGIYTNYHDKRGEFSGHYLKGKGRYWRVNCFGDFQISCPRSEFDRWANSCGFTTTKPKTEAEFNQAIDFLLKMSRGFEIIGISELDRAESSSPVDFRTTNIEEYIRKTVERVNKETHNSEG